MCRWKYFENQLIFGKDMDEILWHTFLGHPVWQFHTWNTLSDSYSCKKLLQKMLPAWLVYKMTNSVLMGH